MIRISHILIFLIWLVYSNEIAAQDIIELRNPSFEGVPELGETYFSLLNWYDCKKLNVNDSPPDVHGSSSNFWEVTQKPVHGNTFVGMVVRQTETHEAIGQLLSDPMLSRNCYTMSAYLSYDKGYRSALTKGGDSVYFNTPTKLIIWGGTIKCEKKQILDESIAIDHETWKEYKFKFTPKENYSYLTLEAFYDTPVLLPYNGNILIDHLSSIVQINCDENVPEKPLFADTQNTTTGRSNPTSSSSTTAKSNRQVSIEENKEFAPQQNEAEPEISGVKVSDFLNSEKELLLKDLFFEADSFVIKKQSFPLLDEIFAFMQNRKGVELEIGGHTNGLPPNYICDTLSQKRAEAVKEYLVNKGIDSNRLIAKGYGKRKPIASDKTHVGRARNQRVEIKIIKK